jgi:DNA replication protein DnaC
MLDELSLAKERSIEAFTKLKKYYANIRLLIIDEWLLFKISEEDCQNLLQIIDRRTARHSTIVLSQFRPDEWISQMPIQVAAEAITDRLIAQAIEIVVESKESMRKQEH